MDPKDLPSNSDKMKDKLAEQKPEKMKLKGGVSGDVGVNLSFGKKFRKAMFAEDIKKSLSTTFWERVIPESKAAFMRGLHWLLDAAMNMAGFTNGKGTAPTNYQSYWNGYSSNIPANMVNLNSNGYTQILPQNTGLPNKNDLTFQDLDDAKGVLAALRDHISEVGYVTVNSLYGMIGRRDIDYTWADYGWTNLDNAKIVDHNGGFRLILPKASPIDKS